MAVIAMPCLADCPEAIPRPRPLGEYGAPATSLPKNFPPPSVRAKVYLDILLPWVVVQFGEYILNHCHSEPVLSARNLLPARKQQIPRAIKPRFGMTIPENISWLHRSPAKDFTKAFQCAC
jgi:hypothetical protein